MIEIGDILTLDDNIDYVVAAITEHNKSNYCYLLDNDNAENYIFCEILENNELEEVEDEELINALSEKFREILK